MFARYHKPHTIEQLRERSKARKKNKQRRKKVVKSAVTNQEVFQVDAGNRTVDDDQKTPVEETARGCLVESVPTKQLPEDKPREQGDDTTYDIQEPWNKEGQESRMHTGADIGATAHTSREKGNQNGKSNLVPEEHVIFYLKKWRDAEDALLHTMPRGDFAVIQRDAGEGVFGYVSAAMYGGMKVALKTFKEDSIKNAKWEAEILSKLRNPHVLFLLGVDFSQPPYIIATRYVGNVTEKPLTVLKMIEQNMFAALDWLWTMICAQVADGLQYLHHTARIVHNDLKTDNVVLEELPNTDGTTSPTYNAVIVDFGKSSIIGIRERRPTLGPLEVHERAKRYPHVAKELWKGVQPSPATDMYSYGYFLKQVYKCLNSKTLRTLYRQCRSEDPTQRPTALFCYRSFTVNETD